MSFQPFPLLHTCDYKCPISTAEPNIFFILGAALRAA